MKKYLLIKPNQPTSSSTSLLLLLLFLLTLLLQFLSGQSSSAHSPPPPQPPPPHSRHQATPLAGLTMEEKMRLGSMPPSCYNKCNGCHPCMAVQVPSGPVSHHARPIKNSDDVAMKFLEPSSSSYSNYKPLGWKCRCRNHFYNP